MISTGSWLMLSHTNVPALVPGAPHIVTDRGHWLLEGDRLRWVKD